MTVDYPTASSRHSSPALHATSHQCLQHVHSSQFLEWHLLESNGFKWIQGHLPTVVERRISSWLTKFTSIKEWLSTLSHVFLALGCRQMFWSHLHHMCLSLFKVRQPWSSCNPTSCKPVVPAVEGTSHGHFYPAKIVEEAASLSALQNLFAPSW